jgi:hypothetical protein
VSAAESGKAETSGKEIATARKPVGRARPAPANIPERTRSGAAVVGAELIEVRQIYIDPLGKDEISGQFRTELSARFNTNTRLTVIGDRDSADAVFKGVVQKHRLGVSARLELVNVGGKVVWSGVYRGSIEQVASKVEGKLKSDIEKLEKKVRR